MDLNRERRTKAGKYVLCDLALYTRSETSTIVKSATGLDGASLHAKYSTACWDRCFDCNVTACALIPSRMWVK